MKKFFEKCIGSVCMHKWIAWGLTVLFIGSLIPVLYLCGYDHATGDDLGYGFRAHHAWLDTHSIWQVLKASAKTVRVYWDSWQGTWFTIFLMTLQPEVFSTDAYWTVPWIMLAINITVTSVILHEILVRRLKLGRAVFVCTDILALTSMIQFFPSTKSGIFWYNGAVHYIVPYCLAMLAIWCFLKFEEKPAVIWFVGALLCMTGLGGSSYLAALLAPVALFYILCVSVKKKKYMLWMLIPLMFELAGLAVSFLSPGNKTRGGEEFGFSIGRAVTTVLQCFAEGIRSFVIYITEKPAALLILVFAGSLLYTAFKEQKQPVCTFRLPGLFAALMFATWCAMFAPGIYAGVEVSGGVPNTIWQVFVLTFLASLLYFAGWLAQRSKQNAGMITFGILLTVCFLAGLLNRSSIRETTFFQCCEYVSSGQAQDYREQMKETKSILLDDTVKEAYLPAINDNQGPLMHMPVTTDEEAFTNRVVRDFYRKDKVLMRE